MPDPVFDGGVNDDGPPPPPLPPALPPPEPAAEAANAASGSTRPLSLDDRLAAVEQALVMATAALERLDQARERDAAIRRSGALNPDATAAALDAVLAEDAALSVPDALQRLRRRRPDLFPRRTPAQLVASAMSAEPRAEPPPDPRRALADRAAAGDRQALAEYLRIRRNA